MLREARLVQEALADELADDGLDLLGRYLPGVELVTHLLLGSFLPGAIGAGLGMGCCN